MYIIDICLSIYLSFGVTPRDAPGGSLLEARGSAGSEGQQRPAPSHGRGIRGSLWGLQEGLGILEGIRSSVCNEGVRAYIYIYIHRCISLFIYTYYVCIHIDICMCICACMYIYIYVYMSVCACVRGCVGASFRVSLWGLVEGNMSRSD